jgi:IMP and pyridine-specific 5'-nucleotidase
VAVVTAAGYEYQTEKYELRLSGLLAYFKQMGLPAEDCERFYLFGGECNYLLSLGHDYKLHPVKEWGAGGWQTSSKFIQESPANWEEDQVQSLLDSSEACFQSSLKELKIRGRIIRKKRSVGLIPNQDEEIPREALDETIIRVQTLLETNIRSTSSAGGVRLPYCAFNGGRDAWVDVGNKRVGVHILSAYLGTSLEETLHIGDQFLNTGNDFAARDICPCIWITSPEETTYILKSILRLAGISPDDSDNAAIAGGRSRGSSFAEGPGMLGNEGVDMTEIIRRHSQQQLMDVYTGELIGGKK